MASQSEAIDVLIVGAGISGINCAYRLQNNTPDVSYTILESRNAIGGTWDVWRYPGVRSDSDISTLAFPWHHWVFPGMMAPGSLMLEYMKNAASKHGILGQIQFRHKVLSADWSSADQQWRVSVNHDGQEKQFHARFLMLGTGFFDYDELAAPQIPGLDKFAGRVINPQAWPTEYDYTNQRLVVVGSGATAVGLIPALPEKAAQVTMIQRSPSHITPMEGGPIWAHKYFPLSFVYTCRRFYNNVYGYCFVKFCEAFPKAGTRLIRDKVEQALPKWVTYAPHFQPRYDPWVQRMSIDPEGAFYKALHRPNVLVKTGVIQSVTDRGLMLSSGETIETDAIITATGFHMKLGGNIRLRVDDVEVSWPDKLIWNGCMLDGVPNMLFSVGYPKASWTMGADATAFILIRLLKHMTREGIRSAVPIVPQGSEMQTFRLWEFESSFVRRADATMPVTGNKGLWRRRQNPVLDLVHARWGSYISDLDFTH
ncbi:hypothetical protein GGR56DRAFT_617818 [Xylariaceae sp. FL0804]|nr:hypothetical protein GGR56DRAFT_617818 [Xylariaceae sp. FL0804]